MPLLATPPSLSNVAPGLSTFKLSPNARDLPVLRVL